MKKSALSVAMYLGLTVRMCAKTTCWDVTHIEFLCLLYYWMKKHSIVEAMKLDNFNIPRCF